MRKLTPALVVCLATVVPLTLAAPVSAGPRKPKPDLVTTQVTASYAAGRVTAAATVKNKGKKKAPASVAAFYLSTDALRSSSDTALGAAQVRKIKPKRSKPVSGTFTVPASVAPGAYHVVVCADSNSSIKERKETNNCSATSGTVTVSGTGTGGGAVTVSATAGAGGTVAASGVTGGTCAATTCTFTTPGTGTVTFTPNPAADHRFGAWTGTTCTGYTTGADHAITFTKPTASKACTATFVRQVTVAFAGPTLAIGGSVSGAASNGSCTAADPISGQGTCTVDAGVGSVTLLATPAVLFKLGAWSAIAPAVCDGVPTGNTMVFAAPTTDKGCSASFVPDLPI